MTTPGFSRVTPAEAAAAEQHAAAKSAYRADQSGDAKTAKRAAGEELRYVRWVGRGGPEIARAERDDRDLLEAEYRAKGEEPPPWRPDRAGQANYERWLTEQKKG